MGLFDAFKKKSIPSKEAIVKLDLRKKELKISLEKKPILNNLTARVCVVLDKSGSMGSDYRNGTVQNVIERVLPLALNFDDNGELEVWLFDDGYKRMPSITEKDFSEYVQHEILDKKISFGMTKYSPVMKDICKKYLNEEKSIIPTYVIFITDGDNSDHTETENIIKEASKNNIFWQFIGIGGAQFTFLKKLDDMSGRVLDNANFFEVNNISAISDGDLYNKMLNEFPSWLVEAKNKGILK